MARITLHIDGFRSCDKWLRKVEDALTKLGVTILLKDITMGNFTISTYKSAQEIVSALESRLKKNIVIVSCENNASASNTRHDSSNTHRNVNHDSINVELLKDIVAKLSGELDSVEFTRSSTVKCNLVNRRNRDDRNRAFDHETTAKSDDFEYVYPPVMRSVEPSAPPIPILESEDYGWSFESGGFGASTSSDDQGSFFVTFVFFFILVYIKYLM